ncbi:hypothetical protein [Vibrio cyclitrophicus]|uniref:Uncharacterized protein n=1 Tax=Vibrio cyclitrophicus TaxID=47951 RepID=A0ACD5FWB5_9VIBR
MFRDRYWDEYVEKAKAEIIKNGGEIVEADIATFQDKVQPVYKKFARENPQLEELINALQTY